ncbi:ATP phosphoribosyltransferase regulatory subunit [Halonatronum saccharophilum]|uniref:ATP phosphoribosyltransferase regulatory subunit n=1 Tax=Halonatronum saccharophilum TaxID=150060 RepID=UPI0004B5194C|nr:ATP phosphoribosyltransferase regulatory subunit [Halonatronum saccharophilum]
MNLNKLQRPEGTKDYLPQVAIKKRYIEDSLYQTFKGWGYREIITPTFEHYDILSAGTEGLQTKIYKFFDRKGQILALRPEMTASIARAVATKLKDEPLPLRLSYQSNVFRYEKPRAGRYREFSQGGIELFGVGSPMGDAEVIAIAAKALEGSGLKNFKIDIGDVDYFTGIMREGKLDKEIQLKIRRALSQKNLVELKELLDQTDLNSKGKEAILEGQNLRGGLEVIEKAKQLVGNQESLESLINLEEVYKYLNLLGVSQYICIDLSVVRSFDYYTGIVFEGYSEDLGYTICGGGRYDRLVDKFGYSIPATGFAIGIDRLLLSLEEQNYQFPIPQNGTLVLFDRDNNAQAFSLVDKLREEGEDVEFELYNRSLDQVIDYSLVKGLNRILILGDVEGKDAYQTKVIEGQEVIEVLLEGGLKGE